MAARSDDHVGDVEKQLSTTFPQSPPAITTAPDNCNVEVQNQTKSAPDPTITTTTTSATAAVTATPFEEDTNSSVWFPFVVIFYIVLFPFLVAYVIGLVCLPSSLKWPGDCCSGSSGNSDGQKLSADSKGIYKKGQEFRSIREKIGRLNRVATTRFGCLLLVWLVVNLCVPSLTSISVFGYLLWKWSLLAVIIALGYPSAVVASLLLQDIIVTYNHALTVRCNLRYYTDGLQNSFTIVLHFASILLLWLLYFRTDNGLNPSKKVDKFGTWTIVWLLVLAIICALKSAILLKWKANAIHNRFKGRILMAGFQLYFLSFIMDRIFDPRLLPWRDDKKPDRAEPPTMVDIEKAQDTGISINDRVVDRDGKILCVQDYMSSEDSKHMPIDQIHHVAESVMRLAMVTQREDDGLPEIVTKCRVKIRSHNGRVQNLTKDALMQHFGLYENDAQLLLEELKKELSSQEITYDTFQKWMVEAHKNCLSLAYTLRYAFEVVSVLNRVIVGFFAVVIVLLWFLTMELATTKMLVLLASPFLSFTFVFGDTCKTFFQGIIFSFVIHPFDVGDRCIIDGMELEVKCIGILTTTFIKIGTKEKILYPSTSLATKDITNLEGEPDPSDEIELLLDSSTTKSKIIGLREDIKSYFEGEDQRSYGKDSHDVMVKEIGSSIKLTISFTHLMDVQDVSHSQCLQRKNKQRSELLIEIRQFLENRNIKVATLWNGDSLKTMP